MQRIAPVLSLFLASAVSAAVAPSEGAVTGDRFSNDSEVASLGGDEIEVVRRFARSSRRPGSVLIFPVHRSGPAWLTILNVSNTSTLPDGPTTFGGSTNAHFEYVNVQPNPTADVNPLAKFMPVGCTIFDRIEFMTPADHLSVLTACHNAFAGNGQEGYVVVSAEDPARPVGGAWKHDYLIGSEVVMSAGGVTYMLNAISIQGVCRDQDDGPLDGPRTAPVEQLDPIVGHHCDLTSGSFPYTLEFDGWNYRPLPDYVLGDFLGVANSQLALINFTGGPMIENTVYFEVYNDNELPLSATLRFRCWFDQPLECVSPLFSEANLAAFPNDPEELDITCDGVGDLETGWFAIRSTGTWFSGGTRHSDDGAIHGSLTAGHGSLRGGHLLWEEGFQRNGAFRTP